MTSPRVRAIIFDIGGVLVRMNVSRATNSLAQGLSLTPEEIWSSLQKDPRWQDWQEGRISPRDWHKHVEKRLGGKLSSEQFIEAWNCALDPEPIQDHNFLQKLSNNYRLAVLSNTDPIHVAHLERTYDFFGLFPTRIYSCRVGACKPSLLIYKQALLACRVRAEESIYIDDIARYAQAAEHLGMRSIVFESVEQVRADLRVFGVRVDCSW